MISHSRTNANKYFSLSSISAKTGDKDSTNKFKIKHIRQTSKIRAQHTLNQDASKYYQNYQSESNSPHDRI
jgi:hypothetical protein